MPQTLQMDSLLEMGRVGDAAQFITIAGAALAQGADDHELRLLLVRRLAEHGLLYRAARVADGFGPELHASPEFADMLRQLDARTNNGLAPWRSLTPRFSANIDALRRRYDWADDVVAAWRADGPHLELHRTTASLWQVFDTRGGDAGGWRPCFGDHRPQISTEQIAAKVNGQVLPPIVIHGVGLGHDLPQMYAATRDTYLGSCPIIYQIEPYLPALAVALHLNDWREVIADERVKICAGEGAFDEFSSILQADDWTLPPRTMIKPAPWDPSKVGLAAQCVGRLTEHREAHRAELHHRISSRYADRDRAHWHRRFSTALAGEGPPLRVLGITSRFTTMLQYSTRDAIRALDALGCRTFLLREPNDHSCLTSEKKLEAIEQFEPDLILVLDHTRVSHGDGMIADVPFVTWIQDCLPWLYTPEAGEAMGPLDFCIGFGRDELVAHYGYPAERFMSCEMATDPAAFFPDGDGDVPSRPLAPFPPEVKDRLEQVNPPPSEGVEEGALACGTGVSPVTPPAPCGTGVSPVSPPAPCGTGVSPVSPPAGRRCHSDEPFACDVAYATHASETAAEFHRQHRRKCAGEASRRVVDAIYEEVTALAGKSQLHGGLSWDFFVDRVQKATGIELPSDQRCDLTTKCLHPMVDRLLRHQTVSWTARWAEATGRRFNLYGLGWENHPEYAKYARGAVKHGLDLGRAFRGAAVHLHAGCNPATHQRVLDGLAAGGFFLVRRHIGDVGCRFMRAAFEVIERKGVKLGETVELWKDLPVPMTEQWIAYRRMRGENPYEPAVLRQEHVDAYQRYRQSSNPPPAADLWPEFYDITFAGEDELVEKLEWFLARDDERCSIAASMRRRVLERFTYEGLMRRLLQWLTAKLGE